MSKRILTFLWEFFGSGFWFFLIRILYPFTSFLLLPCLCVWFEVRTFYKIIKTVNFKCIWACNMFCKSLQKVCVVACLVWLQSDKIVHSSWADHLQEPPPACAAYHAWQFWLLDRVSKEILAFGGLFFIKSLYCSFWTCVCVTNPQTFWQLRTYNLNI